MGESLESLKKNIARNIPFSNFYWHFGDLTNIITKQINDIYFCKGKRLIEMNFCYCKMLFSFLTDPDNHKHTTANAYIYDR